MPATTASATSSRSFRIAPQHSDSVRGNSLVSFRQRPVAETFHLSCRRAIMGAMSTFAVVASRATPTNARLGALLTPAQAVARLRPGDVALGRLDVSPSLDGIEPGLWALDVLERRGVTVLNGRDALASAHD